MKKFVLILVACGLITGQSLAQKLIKDTYTFVPAATNGTIEWDKFPEFSAPEFFKVIYQGPRFTSDKEQKPLKHGFSHLATYNFPYDSKVPFKNRAGFSTGIARGKNNYPWGSECVSPWGNDMDQIKTDILGFAGLCEKFNECAPGQSPVDLFVHDFEANATNDNWIKSLKNLSCTPAKYKALSDEDFIKRYKIDMIKMHAEIMRITQDELVRHNAKISLYGEAPIHNRFYDIAENGWSDYGSAAFANYMMMDTTLVFNNNGPVGKHLDFVTPWVYYFHKYDEGGIEGNKGYWSYLYLPYLLFMIESQMLWTKKDVIPYVQMRIQDPTLGYPNKDISPEMAEATPIFAMLSGAKGLWLWDEINTPIDIDPNNTRSYQTYEYFIAGLYRISRHKHMFEGGFSYFRPKNPVELAGVRQPVVRGVVNGGRILIAAQHPNANPEDETKVDIEYKGWKDTITLKGREVYLGEAIWDCSNNNKSLCPPITAQKIKLGQ